MSDNNNDPKLSKGLRIFIVVGTIIIVLFSAFYYTSHSGGSEYTRTEIEPDSNLADKELVVKQDTLRRDTAAADSANKEEEEQAKKVYNSIRGNVRHRSHNVDNTEEETDDGSAADASADAGSQTDADKATAAPASPKQEPSAKSPKVENIE